VIKKIYILTIFIFFSLSGIAYSYIDLSQLAVFLQIIFAGLLTALLTINLWFKQIIKKIKEFLSKFKKKSKP
jgi:hypothetical protein